MTRLRDWPDLPAVLNRLSARSGERHWYMLIWYDMIPGPIALMAILRSLLRSSTELGMPAWPGDKAEEQWSCLPQKLEMQAVGRAWRCALLPP